MKPGIYHDIPFTDYCGIEAVNMSRLKKMRHSPLHYKTDRAISARPQTLLAGSLIHAALLEPLEIPRHYVVEPDWRNHPDNVDATGKQSAGHTAWVKERKAEFASTNAGKSVVPQDMYDTALACSQAVARSDIASDILHHRGGKAEVTIVWEDADTGILCKGRIDWLLVQKSLLADVKTCNDYESLVQSNGRLFYYAQAAFYRDGYAKLAGELLDPWIIGIERELPHSVLPMRVHPAQLIRGRKLYRKWLRRLAECMETDQWPGIEHPEYLPVPPYCEPVVNPAYRGKSVQF